MRRRTERFLILIALPLLTLSTANNALAQVCVSLTLNTQAQVDAVNCSSVTGMVTISGSDITSLAGLSSITSVGGNLVVLNNTLLTNLDGLAGISSVGGYLSVWLNAVLTNLDGLSGIASVADFLRIHDNGALANLDGLGGITSVGSDLGISNNAVLDNFCGLFPLLDAGGLFGPYSVNTNAIYPTEADILVGGACPVSTLPSLSSAGIAILCSLLGLAGLCKLKG